jgi:hypothetical protein
VSVFDAMVFPPCRLPGAALSDVGTVAWRGNG